MLGAKQKIVCLPERLYENERNYSCCCSIFAVFFCIRPWALEPSDSRFSRWFIQNINREERQLEGTHKWQDLGVLDVELMQTSQRMFAQAAEKKILINLS